MYKNNVNLTTQTEIIRLCDVILTQNYVQFGDSYCLQKTGLAMGAPTSSIFSEIYLQFIENTVIYDILTKHNIIGYFRYVDDILIIYKDEHTGIHLVLDLFNNASPTPPFTTKKKRKKNNSINFLDISICKNNNISFIIYRKPTATHHTIPHDSNHPPEHKLSTINYLSNWLIAYPLNDLDENKEHETVRHILHNTTLSTINTKATDTTRHLHHPTKTQNNVDHIHL